MNVPLAACAIAALLLASACGGGGGDGEVSAFEGDGYSFSYPGDWDELDAENLAETANTNDIVTVGPGKGVDLVQAGSFTVPVSVTEANIEQYQEEIAAAVAQLFRGIDGTVESGPVAVTVGGLPGYRFEATNATPTGERVQTTFFQLYDGTTGYFLTCQHTPGDAEEVEQACEQIEATFSVE